MLDKIVNEIKKYDTIIIIRHQNPDPDAIGSQTGLANILKETFPEKKFLHREPIYQYSTGLQKCKILLLIPIKMR